MLTHVSIGIPRLVTLNLFQGQHYFFTNLAIN
jgi:hypothetical protein